MARGTRTRSLRMGDTWDSAASVASEHDVHMSDLVRVAIERLMAAPDLTEALLPWKRNTNTEVKN